MITILDNKGNQEKTLLRKPEGPEKQENEKEKEKLKN